jgi:hypothetical protein
MISKGKIYFRLCLKKRSLVFYQEMKQKWGREEYIELCSRNEGNGLGWMKAGVWKLRGIRRGLEKGTCRHKHTYTCCLAAQKPENGECNL